jgi:hypothetical protein
MLTLGAVGAAGTGEGDSLEPPELLHAEGIDPSISSIVLVTSTELLPDSAMALRILWFMGHGHSGWVVSAPSL